MNKLAVFSRLSVIDIKITWILSLFIVALISPYSSSSQTSIGNYFAVQYMKVHPSMENDFIRLETKVWHKIHAERIKKDILDGWYLYRVISPAGTNAEYNYVIVQEYDTADKLAAHFDGYGVNYSNLLESDEIQLALRTPEICDMTYEEVWTTVDQMMIPNTDQIFKYIVFNSMKMKPNVDEGEYQRMEKEYWKPMHQERMKRNEMFGWGLYTMIIPGGTERNYHWATVDYYHNFIDYLGDTDHIMNSLHGKVNAEKYLAETIAKRDLLKSEIRELVEYITDTNMN